MKILMAALLPLLLFSPGFLAAEEESPPQISFRDFTSESGIDFRHTFGDARYTKILKATGSGVAMIDYDADGDLDLYFVNGCWLPGISDEAGKTNEGATNRLFRNEGVDPQTGAPKFTDVTVVAGAGDTGYGMGVVTADFDNDGYADLYVTNYGPNVLYRNNGDGTFSDVTAAAGVAGPEKVNGQVKWSTNAVFFDYDRDGRLDLFVCNYLAFDPASNAGSGAGTFPGPLSYPGQASILYRNRGDGTFEDVTEKAGLDCKDGRGMGASAGDLNNDGWPDLYEANDAMANYFWVNQGDGTFKDMAEAALLAHGPGGKNTSTMHAAMADIDRDGWLDVFIPDTGSMALFRNVSGENEGVPLFEDITVAAGIAKICGPHDAWGGLFVDYDNDGWPDIFMSTGGAQRPDGQPSLVLRNRGDRTFADVSVSLNEQAFSERRLSRGCSVGDLDNDGDLDIAQVNIDVAAGGKEGLPTLFLNEGGNRAGHWLAVKLVGTKSNRDGIGARVRVTAGECVYVDEARTAPGYLSSTDSRVHFGLGAAEKVDKVEVEWPSGIRQTIEDVAIDQFLPVTEKGEPPVATQE